MLKGYSSSLVCHYHKVGGLVNDKDNEWSKSKQQSFFTKFNCYEFVYKPQQR